PVERHLEEPTGVRALSDEQHLVRPAPSASNSGSCAAVAPYAGPPALFDRVNTKTCPRELTATPETSPRFIPSGSRRKSGTDSNASCGTSCLGGGGRGERQAKDKHEQRGAPGHGHLRNE
ncbi:MAG: hypothetical protein AB7N65_31800, partial [Vicinamibacterales bacterium]